MDDANPLPWHATDAEDRRKGGDRRSNISRRQDYDQEIDFPDRRRRPWGRRDGIERRTR